MFKRTIVAVTILMATLCFMVKADAAKPDNWLIYWYVCGTDIETTRIAFGAGTDLMSNDPKALILAEPDREPGDATRCIKEVERATLSPNVKIFMQAGGTYIWGHEKLRNLNAKIDTGLGEGNVIGKENAYYKQWLLREDVVTVKDKKGKDVKVRLYSPEAKGKLGRYVYDKDHRNWHAREILPISGAKNTETDMGSKAGFKDFLQAGQELERSLYPDGNVCRILILKDHGSGIRICSDEYTKNIIPVNAIKEAFAEVQGNWTNPDEKPFEVVVFDACLMSTYETAVALEDAANYMVASQETTMGKVGLDYTGLLNELSKNPAMSGKELGKVICDTRWEDSKTVDKDFGYNTVSIFTESVIDLSAQKMEALKTAYANFNEQATKVVQENPNDIATFVKLKNAANVAERYPSSSDVSEQWLVDLKNFSGNLEATFPELKEASRDLVKALNNSVVYNKRGGILNRGGGLSAQFPGFYRTLQNNMQRISVDLSGLKDEIVEVDPEKKTAKIELSEEDLANVESVRYQLIYIIPRNDGSGKMDAMSLGSDSDVEENRETGTVTISFDSQKWVMLDGKPLLVLVTSDATQKGKNGKKVRGNDICVSPILLNGEAQRLFFSRSYPNGKVTLIGAVPIPENDKTPLASLPSDELKSLKKGDVVTPLYVYYNDEYKKAEYVHGIPITIGDKPKLEMNTLPDGIFGYGFEFVNPVGSQNTFAREGVICKIKDGKIVKAISSDDFESPGDLED
ncbi:MAG: hypothetical protein IKN16_06045 [Selenomonadaceae bacterium]|nr:hypothetical protein [Selenomonadaceae bacterium]